MMRVLKYMYLTIKILLLPVVIALMIYFRAVIFQPHISQYADDAQSYLEKRYDISIPVHVVDNSENEAELNQLSKNSDKSGVDSSTVVSLDNKSSSAEISSLSDNSVDELADYLTTEKVNSESARPRVVEQEILIILNNNSSKKSTKDYSVDKMNQQTVEPSVETVIGVDVPVAEITDALADQLIDESVDNKNHELVDRKNKDIDPAIMEKLSETVDIINRKVDMLFSMQDLNKDITVSAENSDDIAIIKKQVINSESIVPPVQKSNQISALDVRDMLRVARQAFWNGNPVDSEKIYLDLLDLQVNNPDVYGELGNVYYSQGKWQQAGKAYYEAALRLLDLKQTQQVNYLLRLIQGLDAESAEKLKLKISG